MIAAKAVTQYLTGALPIADAEDVLDELRKEIPTVTVEHTSSLIAALVQSGLAASNSDARRLLAGNAIHINGQKVARDNFEDSDFQNGRLLLRRGKAFKDSALIELGE
jgi:tyrosyl-tRNA synthetase